MVGSPNGTCSNTVEVALQIKPNAPARQSSVVDSDLAAIAKDIRGLSALLHTGGNYWWPSTDSKSPEGDDTKLFSHFAMLLDIEAAIPVAVTGTLTAGKVAATIVCSRRGEHHLEQQLLESKHVEPSCRNLEEILRQ